MFIVGRTTSGMRGESQLCDKHHERCGMKEGSHNHAINIMKGVESVLIDSKFSCDVECLVDL